MELNGEEKRIRALFHEMKLEDERATPTFAHHWKQRSSRRGAPLSFGRVVFAVSLVCLVLVSTLLLRRQFFVRQPPRHEVAKQLELDGSPDPEQVSKRDEVKQVKKDARKPKNRVASRRQLAGAIKNARLASSLRRRKGEAANVSDWQSPTRAFLRSPGEELLRSFHPLNQSSVELGSFLHGRLN